jgi:hypothetical protein
MQPLIVHEDQMCPHNLMKAKEISGSQLVMLKTALITTNLLMMIASQYYF